MLLHQQHGAAAFDFAGDLTMHVGWHARNAPGQNLTAFGDEFLQ